MSEIIELENKEVKEPDIRAIDVMVWGGSRPKFFRKTIEAFKKYVTFDGRLRFFLLESNLEGREKETQEALDIAKEYNFDGYEARNFDNSYGYSMRYGIDAFITAPIMFSLEDDRELIVPLDLGACFDIMSMYFVSQTKFNGRANESEKGGFVHKEKVFEDKKGKLHKMCVNEKWTTAPALWNMRWARPRLNFRKENVHFWFAKPEGPFYKGHHLPPIDILPQYIEEHFGFYYWGGVGDGPYLLHLAKGKDSIRRRLGYV
jgi:hypothetical protein